jgi:hypothetical protein
MLTLDYGGSPDTRSHCPLSLTANPGGWDALLHESPVPWRRTRHPRASRAGCWRFAAAGWTAVARPAHHAASATSCPPCRLRPAG